MTNFILLPLTFLSGTFYSVDMLPAFAHRITHWNPVFYLIDGFRYGFTGHADGSILVGVALTVGANAVLWLITDRMFRTGYRLKT
jgi:ABC-2 type transport system permease protein